MAPPPVTPSPHRFLTTPKPHQRVQRPSNLPLSDRQPQLPSSSQQFNTTPRFIFSTAAELGNSVRRDRSNGDRDRLSSLSSPIVSRRVKKVDRSEEVEEAIESSSDVEPDFDEANSVRKGAQTFDPILPDSEENDIAFENAPKRRRLSQTLQESIKEDTTQQQENQHLEGDEKAENDNTSTESDVELEVQPTLRPATSHGRVFQRPRFIFPTVSRARSVSPPGTAAITSYARSLRPSSHPISHQVNEEAVLLSPHKRGKDRYVPGSLAAQLRDWAVQATTQSGHIAGDGIVEKIKVEETRGHDGAGHMVMLKGRRGEEQVKLLLVGAGGPREGLSAGVVVGLKGPIWDIELCGETWLVGVEWRIVGK